MFNTFMNAFKEIGTNIVSNIVSNILPDTVSIDFTPTKNYCQSPNASFKDSLPKIKIVDHIQEPELQQVIYFDDPKYNYYQYTK